MVKENIQMVDLKKQYLNMKAEIDQAIQEVVDSTRFIGGPVVKAFQQNLAEYLDVAHVIPCANGTDALQIALMALDLEPGDEVIVPSFTYVATAEVIGLLNLKPVMVDVDPKTFNITADIVEKAVTARTKVIVPVHLFGQSSDMEPIMEVARKHQLYVIEDNAQAIGSLYTFQNGKKRRTGTIGHIGTTSFFPSKNLGCYGDGGAMFTNDDELAARLRMIANHGQKKKYHHSVIGCNSRLDALQAAVLNVKLRYLDDYSGARQQVAAYYDQAFSDVEALQTPFRQHNSTHVFHQYTMQVGNGKRDELKAYLNDKGIPSMIYYPVPLYEQDAFKKFIAPDFQLPVTEALCKNVLSLPIHTEMEPSLMEYIANSVKDFFQ
ncbi:MAG: DegT/DnrJ/EryC1/StrS family aminotransferase [Bacteroidota bacterium]